LSEEASTPISVLHKNRQLVLAMLSVPIFGMILAVVLIVYTRPRGMIPALGVVLFLAVQYILMMYFWLKRLERLVAKHEQETPTSPTEEPPPAEEAMLVPEEERVFPIKQQ